MIHWDPPELGLRHTGNVCPRVIQGRSNRRSDLHIDVGLVRLQEFFNFTNRKRED
jgi:hypothetical protein